MADGSLPIVVTPEAFGRDAFDLTVVEGLTVRAMLVEAVRAGLPIEALNRTEIYVDGARLDRDMALDHVLTADQVVNVVVEPMGGGGGRKDIGQILLTVAVIAVSAWVGGGAATPAGFFDKLLVRTALAGSVALAGQALIGALYGPSGGPAKANDRYALQSASNQYRQWGPMPLALGEVVVAPDLAAKTFTQSQGDDVWMYGILGVHYGPCEVSEVKIGDTLVSTMGAGDFRMVQHLEPGPRTFQLYPNDVDQLDLNEELKATPSSATPLIRAASSDGSRFDIDLFLPAGLCFQKDDGRLLTAHASVAVRYRPIDQSGVATGPWQAGPIWARTSATKDPIRVSHSVHLPHGRYEFELIRNRPDDDNDKRRDTVVVSAIKSVAFRKPVADETLSIIEFAVRATAINQGGLAPITCRIKPKCATWTGSAWGPPVATSNPAALARWLLTGPAPAKPLLPAQADARLRVWHQLCEQYDWKCHFYLTEARTQSEALAILERAGRAGMFWDGTQLAASPWVEKPIPAQVFTDRNLKDHRWETVYSDPVHALRVEFQNIEKGGEPDELFVYSDGYGEVADPAKGIKAASLIEALTLDGQATPNRAYRDGRWKLGQRRHQRRIDTWTADVEHLISQYGSRVRLAWNRVGGGSAQVRCRRWSEDGSAVVGLRLSAPVEMFAGVSYAVDLRTKGGLYDGVPIQTQPGVTREILFASARHPSVCPTAGDLIAFGEVEKVSEDVEIIAIEPGENLTAVLIGVRYVAPLLMAGETGPIPPLSSKLSGDRQANPPRPTLLGAVADAHAVRVSFDMPTWRGAPLSGFSVRWRAKGGEGEAGSWAPLPALDAAARELIAPPLREAPVESVEATRVEIEITAATVDGRVSPPLQVTVVKPVPGAPLASVWSVDAKGPDANGVSQPILIVRGEVNDPHVAAVRIAWGLTVDGPWTEAYEGAPLTKALEIGNLTPGVEHFIAITHLSAQGVPSQFLVIGPRVPGQLISGGATHLNSEPVQVILDRLTSTADLTAANAAAVADLDGRVDDTITAAEAAIAAGEAANLAVLKAGEAGEAAEASNTAAGIATTKADEAGASAMAANAEKLAAQAARDTADQKAQASVLAAAQAEAFAGDAGDWAAASEGAAVQAAARAAEGLAYRNAAVDARDGAVAASQNAGVSASTARSAANQSDAVSPGQAVDSFAWNQWDILNATPNLRDIGPVIVNGALRFQSGVSGHVHAAKATAVVPGHKYRISTTFRRAVEGGGTNTVTLFHWAWDANGGVVQSWEHQVVNPTGGGIQSITRDLDLPAGAAWVRAMVRVIAGDGVTDLLTVETKDVQSEVSAANSAAVAQSASAIADASAASAQISADLAVSVSNARQNLLPNSTGLLEMQKWTPYHTSQVIAEAATDGSRFIWYVPSAGALDGGSQSDWIDYPAGAPTSISAEVFTGGMNGGAIRAYVIFADSSRNTIGYQVAEHWGETNQWVFIKSEGVNSPAGTRYARVVMDTWTANWKPAGAVAAWRKIKFENWPTATPWNDIASTEALSARLNITAAVAADAADRLGSARFSVTGGAGGDPFELMLRAGPDGSVAMLSATAIILRNILGGSAVEALKLIDGEAYFGAPVSTTISGRRLTIGPGFGVSNGLVMWFGPSTTATASMSRTNGYFALGTDGKVYYGNAELAGGGKTSGVRVFSSGAGGSSVETTINGVQAGSQISVHIGVNGGSLSTNSNSNGSVRLYEVSGGNSRLLFTQGVVTVPNGLQNPNGSWGIQEEPAAFGTVMGQFSGNVTYRAEYSRSSGSSYVQGAVINASVTITPPL